MMNRENFISAIKEKIEKRFIDVVVLHTGAYSFDDMDMSEEFEVLGLPKAEYKAFRDFTWELQTDFADPLGYIITCHSLSPEATEKYRAKEYAHGILNRRLSEAKESVTYIKTGWSMEWPKNGTSEEISLNQLYADAA